MESGFLLDVVIRQGSSIFELLSGEDQSLLIWWDTCSNYKFQQNTKQYKQKTKNEKRKNTIKNHQ
jgi:hypothetical protein